MNNEFPIKLQGDSFASIFLGTKSTLSSFMSHVSCKKTSERTFQANTRSIQAKLNKLIVYIGNKQKHPKTE